MIITMRPGLDDGRGGHRDMRIDIGHRDGGPGSAARSRRPPPRSARRLVAELAGCRGASSRRRRRRSRGSRASKKSRSGNPSRFDHMRLVAGGARVARLDAGQPPDHPVGRLDQPVGGRVDLGRLVEDLQRLARRTTRSGSCRRSGPAMSGVSHGDLVDPIGLGLGGVVLPELDPRVRVRAEFRKAGERRPVRGCRQHRAGGEVDAEPDDFRWIHAVPAATRGNGVLAGVRR